MTMHDAWVAECLPCKLEEHFPTQDEAIGAAQFHILTQHGTVNPHQRMLQRIGHVQQRTVASDRHPVTPMIEAMIAAPTEQPSQESTELSEASGSVSLLAKENSPENSTEATEGN